MARKRRKRSSQAKLAAQKRWKKQEEVFEDNMMESEEPEPVISRSSDLDLVSDREDVVASTGQCSNGIYSTLTTSGDLLRQTQNDTPLSASSRKLLTFDDYHSQLESSSTNRSSCYRIVDLNCLSNLVSGLACSNCDEPKMAICEDVPKCVGFARQLELKCCNCGYVQGSSMTSPLLDSKKRIFEVNRLSSVAFVEGGSGYAGMEKFCSVLNSPCLSSRTFGKHVSGYKVACESECDVELGLAAEKVREYYRELDPTLSESDVIDICVSFDGTWRTRGRTSHHGAGYVIDALTGLVVDFYVCSTFCYVCASIQSSDRTPEQQTEAMKQHRAGGSCEVNFTGSAGAMEVHTAEILWGRSIEKNSFRYTTLIGDGDARTFSALEKLAPYGADTPLKKEECINHVGKRMGTALRKLVADQKVGGNSIGGRGEGKLNGPMIDKLTSYYANAIKKNLGDPQKMQEAVFATLLHVTSTDESPNHGKCPQGEDSWCFYQRSNAMGEEPARHKDKLGTLISRELAKLMYPIYQRLADLRLLERCSRGKTQNPNESIHNILWSFLIKSKFSGLAAVQMAASRTACHFNSGARSLSAAVKKMGIQLGDDSQKILARRDATRKRMAEAAAKKTNKKVRRAKKKDRLQMTASLMEKEGHLYKSGEGD